MLDEGRPDPRTMSSTAIVVLMALSYRQVNLTLEALIALSLATGVASWIVALDWARPLTVVHAISGLSIVLLMPLKIKGPVRAGFRRRRTTRWLSATFGIMVVAAIAFGIAHSTGIWYGVGYWSALWTHLLLGFTLIPLAIWHVWSRPVRPGRADLSRRVFLSAGTVTAVAAAAVVTQEGLVRLAGLDGAERAGTGSHELASFDPPRMPVVSWIDDKTPRGSLADWRVLIQGQDTAVADIAALTTPMPAMLDCTGGWRSNQNWDVVPLTDMVPDGPGRSIKVTSATGYSRLFARSDAKNIYLCTGYGGIPLRRGHGAPLRIVAPGRRGPWWVKWVTAIELSDRPAWLQLPFPAT